MRWGIKSGNLDQSLPYAPVITQVAMENDFPVALAYAIAWHESIQGEVNGKWNAATVESFDGGKGLFQLTSSWPPKWMDPATNCNYAIQAFLLVDAPIWVELFKLSGDALIKCLAATFNAGLSGAEAGHEQGNVDLYDTDNYGAAVLAIYHNIIATRRP